MSEKSDKRSISFSPGSLYLWAKKHGDKSVPSLTVSAVVCSALAKYKEQVEPADTRPAEILSAAKSIGLDKTLDVLAAHKAKARR
jgi:hypothetical protein